MNKNKGFSLIELMVAIAIVAILSAIAVPSYIGWLPSHRLRSAAAEINSATQYTRLAAIKGSQNACVVFDTGNDSYRSFVDNNGDNAWTAGVDRLVKEGNMPAGVDLYDAAFSSVSYTRFNSRGLAELEGHVYLKNRKNEYRGLVVLNTGRSRVVASDDGSSWH